MARPSTKPAREPRPRAGTAPRDHPGGRPLDRRTDKRSLSHVGGAAELGGDETLAQLVASALDVPTSTEAEDQARTHVHGFHVYPARMHPTTARRLVEALAPPATTVLDPFCGSGTVVVEARLAGRVAVGVDANPLAVRLAQLKVRGVDEAERARLLDAAKRAAAVADERRAAKSGASRRYGPDDMRLFAPHVLFELDGLRLGIDAVGRADPQAAADLELVLSSILTKVSRRASDTSEGAVEKRIAAGYPARLFTKKTQELCERLAAVASTLAAAPPARVLEGDARKLVGVADGTVELVVTSPPYPGVYDYLAHHVDRLRWLRLPAERFAEREMGARRTLEPLGPTLAVTRWEIELVAALRAMARVGTARLRAVLLLADSVVARVRLDALEIVRRIAPRAGLELVASASQARPHFHGPTASAFRGRPRREHAVLLVKRS